MTKEEVIQRIEAILSGVAEEWTASDGGLTMAAGDLIVFGRSVIERIQANDTAWIWNLDPYDTDTGNESDIVSLALDWARGSSADKSRTAYGRTFVSSNRLSNCI